MFSSHNSTGRDVAVILVVTALPVMPMFILGYHWGHDLDIHLKSWMEAQAQFRQGIFYPRWASGANYGFGEPRFIFYPPASWMLGGTLGLFLPWRTVPAVFVWLTLIVAAITMRKLAANWLPPRAALLAGILYAVNPYMLVSAYTRCAYGEMLAAAVFPLLLYGAFLCERDAHKSLAVIAISLAAIWLTNLPAGVVASYSLAFVLLILAIRHRSMRPLLYGGAAAITGIGLAAFCLFPAAWERSWVKISATARPNQLPWANFLFSPPGMPNMYVFNHNLSKLALLIICAGLLAAFVGTQMRRTLPDVWWPLTALCGLSALLMFRVSTPLWHILPELRFIQFPWRWLFPLCTSLTLLTVFAARQFKQHRIIWAALALVLLAIDSGILRAREWFPNFADEIANQFQSGAGYNGLEEYAPLSRRTNLRPKETPLVELVGTGDEHRTAAPFVQVESWSPERKVIIADLPDAMILNLKLLAYPAWKATVNGKSASLHENPQTGQIMMQLPAGPSRTEVKFTQTWDRAVGIAISIGTASILLAIWGVLAFKRKSSEGREPQLVPVPAD